MCMFNQTFKPGDLSLHYHYIAHYPSPSSLFPHTESYRCLFETAGAVNNLVHCLSFADSSVQASSVEALGMLCCNASARQQVLIIQHAQGVVLPINHSRACPHTYFKSSSYTLEEYFIALYCCSSLVWVESPFCLTSFAPPTRMLSIRPLGLSLSVLGVQPLPTPYARRGKLRIVILMLHVHHTCTQYYWLYTAEVWSLLRGYLSLLGMLSQQQQSQHL